MNYIIPFIVLITIVVFIHEYGHYYFAKKYGVGITDFSIGFGNEIFGWDVFPTILHLLEENIPNYVDGKVINEIFQENSDVQKRTIIIDKTTEKDFLKSRISELGEKF